MKHSSDVDMIEEVCVIDSLVQDMVDHSCLANSLQQCMSYFEYDFDVDDSISEVNALLDSTPFLDLDSWTARFDLLSLTIF